MHSSNSTQQCEEEARNLDPGYLWRVTVAFILWFHFEGSIKRAGPTSTIKNTFKRFLLKENSDFFFFSFLFFILQISLKKYKF